MLNEVEGMLYLCFYKALQVQPQQFKNKIQENLQFNLHASTV